MYIYMHVLITGNNNDMYNTCGALPSLYKYLHLETL